MHTLINKKLFEESLKENLYKLKKDSFLLST